MLRTETISPGTLELLESLMQLQDLKDFALAGGTNLSLRKGHRLSVDLDLFSKEDFSTEDLLPVLLGSYPGLIVSAQKKTTLQCYINNIKVDIIRHNYPYVAPIEAYGIIRVFSEKDIAAMKINAATVRGARKDFWDIAELLKEQTMAEMLDCYKLKYAANDIFHVVRALVYFDDAEKNDLEEVISLKEQSWENVKRAIGQAVKNFIDKL